jgi:2-haloalkanoic acid dehalogenase type II
MRLGDFQVLSFDCYGTLIDWETGIADGLGRCFRGPAGAAGRTALLAAFARAEAAQQQETPALPYRQVLVRVAKRLAGEFGVDLSAADAEAFGALVGGWQPFPDTVPALRHLRRHYRLIILSNVDRASFEATSRRLEVDFDAVCTAEDIGSYKPDPRNFAYLIERVAGLGLPASAILHTGQSLYHDHLPAKAAGLATAWIDRGGAAIGGTAADKPQSATPDFRFATLGEMAEAHRRELAGPAAAAEAEGGG